ncbi:MAG: carbohydrate ABC transporter permease [Solirubrobacteraceae bacterium]
MTASAASAGRRRAPRARSRLDRHVPGWAFASPFAVILGIFLAIPILASLVLSFTSFNIGNIQSWSSARFVGLDNYTQALTDARVLKSLRNTGYFVGVGVPATIALSLALAVGLNRVVGAMKTVFRVGYYLPVVTSIVAIAVIWRYLLAPDIGLVNSLIERVGIAGPDWLGNTKTAMPSVIAIGVWRNVGFDMVIFLAALQTIDPALYEAAKVDGARGWKLFRFITLPLLRPAMLFVAVVTSIAYLQVFEEPFVMTQGGPVDSTLTTSMLIYEQGFRFFNLGYASAIAYILFVIIAVLAVIQFRWLRPQS